MEPSNQQSRGNFWARPSGVFSPRLRLRRSKRKKKEKTGRGRGSTRSSRPPRPALGAFDVRLPLRGSLEPAGSARLFKTYPKIISLQKNTPMVWSLVWKSRVPSHLVSAAKVQSPNPSLQIWALKGTCPRDKHRACAAVLRVALFYVCFSEGLEGN